MIELDDAKNNIQYLVQALVPLLQGTVVHSLVYRSIHSHLGNGAICIVIEFNDTNNKRLALSADINSKGELYNPVFQPNMLSTLFDWINRLGYDKMRTIKRTEIYKDDLLTTSYKKLIQADKRDSFEYRTDQYYQT